nr:MAG TPA: hypothetical protein [Caudoviricetes sp.]
MTSYSYFVLPTVHIVHLGLYNTIRTLSSI